MKRKLMRVLSGLTTACLILSVLAALTFAAGDPPVLQSAAVVDNGAAVELTFDKDMAAPGSGSAGFRVFFGAIDKVVTEAVYAGAGHKIIRLTLQTTVKGGEDVWLSYTPGTVAAEGGGTLAAIGYQPISNDLPHPTLDTTPPPEGTMGDSYTHTFTVSGGTDPFTFSAGAGLPAGLTLDPGTGELSGTLSAAGSFNFGITVTDSVYAFDSRNFTIIVNDAGGVCQIGATQYDSLDGALAVVDNGETIILLENITDSDGLVISSGKSFTIDLNSHDLDVTNPSADLGKGVEVTSGSEVVLTGSGSFNASGEWYGVYADNATVTVSSAASSMGTAVFANNSANVTVTGDAEGAGAGIYARNSSIITVNGDVGSTNDGVSALDAQGSTIHVRGNVIASGGGSSQGILGAGNITVDGNVEGNQIGVEVGGSSSVITVGGNVTARGTDDAGSNFFCYGAVTSDGNINITGNITAAGGTGVRSVGSGKLTIDGAITAAHYIEFGFGGTKTVKTIDNKQATTTKPGYYTYAEYSGQVWVKATSVPNSVCEIGGTPYETLADALATVGAGQTATIELLDNIDYNKGIAISAGQNIIFDLNNHTLNVVNDSGIGLQVTDGSVDYIGLGEFNVTGSTCGVSANGNDAFTAVSSAVATSEGGNGAVAMNGGNIEVNGNVQGGYNGVRVSGHSSTAVVNGNAMGTASDSSGARAAFGGSIIINGGTAQGVKYGAYANGSENGSNSNITINGGDAIGTGTYSHGVHAEIYGIVNVGGNVQGTQYGVYSSDNTEVVVTGNVMVTANVNGYGVNAQHDGTIKIVGDIVANGSSLGAFVTSGGEITIDGAILASNYIRLFDDINEVTVYKDGSASSRTTPTTKEEYYTYSAGTGTVWVKIPAIQDTVINIAVISGVTPPVTGAIPAASVTETAQYTGSVIWSPAHNPFRGGTVYTATITLIPKAGYTLNGVTVNFFTVAGATATNAANTGVVTAVFPATEAAPVTAYTVTFNSNGSAYATKTVNAGESIGSTAWPADPTRSSYTFGGWFTGANGSGTQFTPTTPVNATMTVHAKWTYSGGGGGGNGGGGSSNPLTPTTPTYNTEVKAGNSTETTLPVTIDKDAGTASIDAGSQNLAQGGIVITVPSIPDVDTYLVGITVPDLSTTNGQSALTIDTETGSVTVPSNMLTGVEGISGSNAKISIGQGDKSSLSEDIKTAIGERPVVQLMLFIDGKQTDWNNSAAPVTVSIPYEPTQEELANPESIVVWYIDGSGNAVCVPNGYYDPATGMVTVDVTHFSDYAVAYNPVSFNDMPAGAWYAPAVSFIASREITTGTGNGKYSPGAKLTRGEFLVMLMKAYGIEPDANPTDKFADAGSTYYTGYLAAAKRLSISGGVGDNMFAPGKEINRQEMSTLLYNALKVIGQLPEGNSGKTLDQFTDTSDIAPWAKDAMSLLVESGAIGGSNGKLNPLSTTTRAEMAQVLYNLLSRR